MMENYQSMSSSTRYEKDIMVMMMKSLSPLALLKLLLIAKIESA